MSSNIYSNISRDSLIAVEALPLSIQ